MLPYAVILAGGSGTRFWPASRRLHPKQLLAISPGCSRSLLAATVDRLASWVPLDHVLVATGAHLVEATRAALPGLPEGSLLGEPVARNTAPCIGWATLLVHRRDPDGVVMVLPSDHHIGDEPAFRTVVDRALASAAQGVITTIGVQPTRPETGYGYIESGEDLGSGVWRVARFVEKPDRARAQEYVDSGRFFWNSGMFFFRAEVMLQKIKDHLPGLYAGLEALDRAASRGPEAEAEATAQLFATAPSISIDYGVLERASPLNVVPGSFGWSDLGSWESAWELSPKAPDGNVLDDRCLVLDGSGNLVRSLQASPKDRVIALVGVDDLCVIDTQDALLILPRGRAQDVRLVVEALKQRELGHLL
jgi:mannose-1-phosphate guanylyltransferase